MLPIPGSGTHKNATAVNGQSGLDVDGLYLAADLAMIVEDSQDEHTPKYVHERKHGQKKKKPAQESSRHGFGMSM